MSDGSPPPTHEAGRRELTRLLDRWRAGETDARDRLTELVYPELRRLAQSCLAGERRDHTLDATAIVHEAYLRLVGSEVAWQDRVHFFAIAARVMRRILVDYAKAKRRLKRGGGRIRVTLDEGSLSLPAEGADVVDLDRALTQLAQTDPRKARVVELHFFAGLTQEEVADLLDVSERTVGRELRFAKAWLNRALSEKAPPIS